MKFLKSTILFSSLIISTNSFACSKSPPENVEISLKQSKAVFLAVAKSIKVAPRRNEKFMWVDEEVVFEIIESWKGKQKIGDVLNFNTTVWAGGCGLSAGTYNFNFEDTTPDGLKKANESKHSNVWLIYSYDENPHELDGASRTMLIENGGAQDMRELYSFTENDKNRSSISH